MTRNYHPFRTLIPISRPPNEDYQESEGSPTCSVSVFDRMGEKLSNKDLHHKLIESRDKAEWKNEIGRSASKGSHRGKFISQTFQIEKSVFQVLTQDMRSRSSRTLDMVKEKTKC